MENLSLGFCDRLFFFFFFFFHFQFLLTLFQGWPEAPLSSPSHCRGWEEGGNQTESGVRGADQPGSDHRLRVPRMNLGLFLIIPVENCWPFPLKECRGCSVDQNAWVQVTCLVSGKSLWGTESSHLLARFESPLCSDQGNEEPAQAPKPSVPSLAEAPVKVLHHLMDGPINVES